MSQTLGNAVIAATINNFASNSTQAVDVVGIFDSSHNQIVPGARPIRASLKEDAEFPKHPLENGATMQDHRIINPIEIELSIVFQPATYVDDYATLKTAFKSNSALTVNTRTGVYPNMFIKSLPHQEDADTYDTIKMILALTEVVIVQSQTQVIPKSASDSATVSRGAQQGITSTAPDGSNDTNGNPTTGSAAYNFFYGGKQ